MRTRSKETSEDLASEVFIKFLKSNYDSRKSSIRTYLYLIAKSILLNSYSSSKSKEHVHLDFQNISIEEKDYETILTDFQNVIQLLEQDDREIIVLKYVDELKIKEIAKILDLSISNVKVRIHRSLKILKQKVNGK